MSAHRPPTSRGEAPHIEPEAVRRFYNGQPFPAYDPEEIVSYGDLARQASDFAKLLHHSLPLQGTFVELGCGTGLMTNWLGQAKGRELLGLDFSAASLALAETTRQALSADNVRFVEGDLFANGLPAESFDVVTSLGVLHHTPRPRAGVEIAAELARPGGLVIIGLYHRWGRREFWASQERPSPEHSPLCPDAFYRAESTASATTHQSWYADQLEHPGETGHTMAEVTSWLRETGCSPLAQLPDVWGSANRLRLDTTTGGGFGALVSAWAGDLRMALAPQERGYFILFARKDGHV